jgi:hypothetical protein
VPRTRLSVGTLVELDPSRGLGGVHGGEGHVPRSRGHVQRWGMPMGWGYIHERREHVHK